MDLAALRQEYMRAGLHEKDLDADPLVQFGRWFDEALERLFKDQAAVPLDG